MNNRQMYTALLVALAVFFLYSTIYSWLVPPPKPAPAVADGGSDSAASQASSASAPNGSQPAPGAAFRSAKEQKIVAIGGSATDALKLEISTLGAAVERLFLTSRIQKKPDRYEFREHLEGNEPYSLLRPIDGPHGPIFSFESNRLRIAVGNQKTQDYTFEGAIWDVVESSPHRAVFSVTLADPGGAELVRVLKSYQLHEHAPLVDFRITVQNLSGQELKAALLQDGPVGFPEEGRYFPSRRVMAFSRKPDGTAFVKSYMHNDLKPGTKPFVREKDTNFIWTAFANKYFGVFMRPVAADARSNANFINSVDARLGVPDSAVDVGDLITRIETTTVTLPAGQQQEFAFEVYAGSKNNRHMAAVDPGYVNRMAIGYVAAHDPDRGCCPCQFEWVNDLMMWALNAAYLVCRNYGWAILLLVVVVRTLLHPLAVYQQKTMYKMQDGMVRLQPKIAALKEKYAGDQQTFAREQMRLYSEEGVNPAAPLIGMVPIFLQMPILIGLWNALNTDVNLRHAPFDGWWIRDLSAPDALISFKTPITIPILGWLPLIGTAFSNIPSLNVLPILMGISMFLQQKYMPKPAMAAKQQALKNNPQAPGPTGMTPEEQMRQQQMVANMMSIMFPIMFYYQPAGLAVYWMFTNIFGIAESLRIRKQIEREKALAAARGPVAPTPRKPGFLAQMMKKMAEKAEEFQKKADELSRAEEEKKKKKDREEGDRRKK